MFGALRTYFFRPENTWENCKKSHGNAGTKGDVTAFHGYLHMNAYPVFLSPRLKTGSEGEEKKKDSEKISDIGMQGLFGGNTVPNFCFSTAKLNTGIQYTEGQDDTINAHNQDVFYPNFYTEEQKVMPFSQHLNGIRWKVLAIMWSRKSNLIAKTAGEPVFLLWSEHITQWYNDDREFGNFERRDARRSDVSQVEIPPPIEHQLHHGRPNCGTF